MNEPAPKNESTMTSHASEERNGVQWQNVGPSLFAFAASVVVAYAVGEGAGWARVEGAFGTAAILLLVTMGVARYAVRLVVIQYQHMNSIKVFIGVWAAVIALWLLAFRH